jgi:hypothetical protein
LAVPAPYRIIKYTIPGGKNQVQPGKIQLQSAKDVENRPFMCYITEILFFITACHSKIV